jgi:hypothetical protein
VSPIFHAPNKEARQIAQWLKELGWEYAGHTGADHPRFEHPVYEPIDIASSASVPQVHAALAEIARKMGITKPELEIRLGRRQPKHQGPRVRRTRNEEGRRARRFSVVRDDGPKLPPIRVGTPAERLEHIKRDRVAAEARQMRAGHGTPAYMCALDDIARCRREIAQTQTELEEAA